MHAVKKSKTTGYTRSNVHEVERGEGHGEDGEYDYVDDEMKEEIAEAIISELMNDEGEHKQNSGTTAPLPVRDDLKVWKNQLLLETC